MEDIGNYPKFTNNERYKLNIVTPVTGRAAINQLNSGGRIPLLNNGENSHKMKQAGQTGHQRTRYHKAIDIYG